MDKNLSLLEYCTSCKAKCCRIGELIGSPILSEEEVSKIEKIAKGHIQKVLSPTGKKYYILREQEGTNKCFFLTKENKCKIQKSKPLDCLCYPIKAVYKDNGSIRFIIDTNCPAAEHLSSRFIKEAKIIALRSIKRFDRKTYQHWLDNNVGWVKKAEELGRFVEGLKSNDEDKTL